MDSKKIHINKDLCTGCGTCLAVAPGCFTLNDDFKVELLPKINESDENIELAQESCPAEAISIF
ncbi:MAG: ferredoxin [Candidatus Magasanikbacteria bacterium CG_4_10_14_0_8_um_filter_32_14]|uniref:Ferredoxin n=1 Tax=Candidatus Magasanikbacteria bacterium CG_4_10_14_0_8_um_filter_32_14 TaxID=1974640 RepID=A0A2M7RA92_9BACT|nr:MAG: ferredoxin [Candidatus Magasanikbacteria bacterium CG_4_10_14_0_8_um_filter_32_14]